MNKRSHNEPNTNTDALLDDGLAGLKRRLERIHTLKQAMVQEHINRRTRLPVPESPYHLITLSPEQ